MAKKNKPEECVQKKRMIRRRVDHESGAHDVRNGKTTLAEDETPYGAKTIRFIDLFCGIGGFHRAIQQAARERGMRVQGVFASDIDSECQLTYLERQPDHNLP